MDTVLRVPLWRRFLILGSVNETSRSRTVTRL